MPRKKTIAVVGGGISGLTCAYELKKAGYNVTVFEKNDYVGGRMATRTKDGLPFDIGANFWVGTYKSARKLLKEIGMGKKLGPMAVRRPFSFRNGQLSRISAKPLVILTKMSSISFRSRIRLLIMMNNFRKQADRLDFYDLSGAAFMDTDDAYNYVKKHAGKDVADSIIEAFTATYQFHSAKEISLAAMAAMSTLMMTDPESVTQYHTAGEMSALPEGLAKKLKVQLNSEVTKVRSKDGQIEIKVNGKILKFDQVVLASTANFTKEIYKNPSKKQKDLLEKVNYATTVNVSFKVPKDVLAEFSVVMVPFVEGGKISEYTNEGIKGKNLLKNGKTLVNVGLHEDYALKIIRRSDAFIFKDVAKALLKVCPLLEEKDLEPYDLQRWPQAMPKYSHEYLTDVKNFMENGQGENGVYFCGDYLNSPWIEGSVRCGMRVANQVVKQLGARRR